MHLVGYLEWIEVDGEQEHILMCLNSLLQPLAEALSKPTEAPVPLAYRRNTFYGRTFNYINQTPHLPWTKDQDSFQGVWWWKGRQS